MTSNILDLDTFINSNADWENLLSKPPYCLKIKRDGHYVLFKYDQLNSDLSLRIVQEARGSIFYEHYNGKMNLICLPFLKFFNYGEKNAVNIEWGTAYVTEKIDGSLMQLWYHDGWHLSTSGTIDAFKAKVGDTDESFGNVFERAIGTDIQDFANKLNLLPAPQIKSDKEMFQYARRCTNADFIMKRHKGHVANATEYINKCDNAQLLRMIFRK